MLPQKQRVMPIMCLYRPVFALFKKSKYMDQIMTSLVYYYYGATRLCACACTRWHNIWNTSIFMYLLYLLRYHNIYMATLEQIDKVYNWKTTFQPTVPMLLTDFNIHFYSSGCGICKYFLFHCYGLWKWIYVDDFVSWWTKKRINFIYFSVILIKPQAT